MFQFGTNVIRTRVEMEEHACNEMPMHSNATAYKDILERLVNVNTFICMISYDLMFQNVTRIIPKIRIRLAFFVKDPN